MSPAGGRVEVLDVYEGRVFVVEGAETGNRLAGLGAKYFGKGFNDAHEDVFVGNARCLMPDIYC